MYLDETILSKLDNCGKEFISFIHVTGETIELPVFCDNRICDNPDCKKHRGYKFYKTHSDQISITQKSMRVPRAWVFTYGHLPYPIDRSLCQQLMLKLYHILLNQSVTNFSIHMELKLHDNTVYLHFHVLLGSLKDLRYTRKLWGKTIRYEKAIKPSDVVYYVSKYAGKTPFFPSELHRDFYFHAVYKLQMHKFSAKHDKLKEKQISDWYHYDSLIEEIRQTYLRDGYTDNTGQRLLNDYHPFLDKPPPLKPHFRPPVNSNDSRKYFSDYWESSLRESCGLQGVNFKPKYKIIGEKINE